MKRREALKNTALLGGTAVFSTALVTLWQACKEQPRLSWEPRFLSTEHAHLVTSLVDTILPTTDTPGGLDVKVDIMIDLMIDQVYDEATQEKLVAAMDQFNDQCVSKFGKVYYQLDGDQQKAMLQEAEDTDPKFGYSIWGYGVGEQKPIGFYRSFKSMAVMAYCTSEEIGKNVLNYDPVPGKYIGCLPFSEVGSVWSL